MLRRTKFILKPLPAELYQEGPGLLAPFLDVSSLNLAAIAAAIFLRRRPCPSGTIGIVEGRLDRRRRAASHGAMASRPAATAPAQAPDREVLAGLVERVTFHNAENGFCVLRVKPRGHRDLVTLVGHAATISVGE